MAIASLVALKEAVASSVQVGHRRGHQCSSLRLTTNDCLRLAVVDRWIDLIDGMILHGQGMHLYTILCMVI